MAFWSRRTASPSPARRRPDARETAYILASDGSEYLATKSTDGNWQIKDGQASVAATWTNTDSGRTSAYESCVWAYRCVNVRANEIAELLHKGQVIDRRTKRPVEDHPLLRAIEWSYRQYDFDFFMLWSFNLDLFGEVFVEKITARFQDLAAIRFPAGLRVLPSLAVEPDIRQGDITRYLYADDSGQMVTFAPNEIGFHRTFNARNPLRGLAPMSEALSAANVDMHILSFTGAYYRNGARVGVIFTRKDGGSFTDADQEFLANWIKKKIKGVGNAFKPLLMPGAVEVKTLEQPDIEDSTGRVKEQIARICAAFNVPIGLVDHRESPFQLSPEQRRFFAQNAVVPGAQQIARFVDAKLRPFFDPKDDTKFEIPQKEIDRLLVDPKEAESMIQSRLDSGRITYNEARTASGQDPITGGDFVFFPTGRTVVPVQRTLAGELTLVLPQSPVSVGQPALTPTGAPPQTALLAPGKSALPSQEDDLDELRAWERKTQRSSVHKALTFICHHVTADIQRFVRDGLDHVTDGDKAAIHAVFEGARQQIGMKASFGPPEGSVVLYLGETESVLEAQQFLQTTFPADAPVRWTAFTDLHITLAHSPLVDEGSFHTAAGDVAVVEPLPVQIEQIDIFPAESGPVPIIARVTPTEALAAVQRQIAEAMARYGIPLSPYGDPATWVPHITLGYIDAEYLALHKPEFFPKPWEGALQVFGPDFTRPAWHSDNVTLRDAGKAIQATRLDFELDFEDLMKAVVGEHIDRRKFGIALRSMLRKYGTKAYQDGLIDGGVEDGELDPEDFVYLNGMLSDQSQFVTAYGDRLYGDNGSTEAQNSAKPGMWWSKSVEPFYQAGRLSADGNGLYEWLLGRTEKHCGSCLRLEGQRHRMRDWTRKGLTPKSDLLECKGFQCDCKLQRSTGRAKGTF